MNDILSLGFMLYTTAVSLEMSDEPEINTDNARIPAVVCDVVQSDNTSDKLENAINTIITRGTYYADGEMLLMSDRYKAVLHSQLGFYKN